MVYVTFSINRVNAGNGNRTARIFGNKNVVGHMMPCDNTCQASLTAARGIFTAREIFWYEECPKT